MYQLEEKSTIQEIHQIRDILTCIHYNTWVIWDLDNTIIQSRHELGSDMWFTFLIAYTIKRFNNDPFYVKLALDLYNHVQFLTHTEPAELPVVKIINYLREIGVPQLIVTARSEVLKTTTIRQLKENGVRFDWNKIIFCDGKNKAHQFEAHLCELKQMPSHFIMIDDKASHLIHMKDLAQKYQISFNGFSYRYLDNKVEAFDMNKANFQLTMLMKHIPIHLKEHAELLSEEAFSVPVKLNKSFTYFHKGEYYVGAPNEEYNSKLEYNNDYFNCRIS
jgi:hypothetical protein